LTFSGKILRDRDGRDGGDGRDGRDGRDDVKPET